MYRVHHINNDIDQNIWFSKNKITEKFHIENIISIFLDTVIPCRTQSTHDNKFMLFMILMLLKIEDFSHA